MNKIMQEIERQFEKAGQVPGNLRRNPITGGSWLKGLDPEPAQKRAAYRALVARERFESERPSDAPPLPLKQYEWQAMRVGGIHEIVSLFARSWAASRYDPKHPSFDRYARGVMASPYAPDYVLNDRDLQSRFPPTPLEGLGPGLYC